LITAATTKQAKAIMGYAKALVAGVPAIAQMVERETQDVIEFGNGISIEVAVCNFKTIRSTTVVCGICDELAFWDGADSANPDREVLAALRPAMASIPASRLFCASSPYGRYGALFEAIERHHGKDESPVLTWWAPTRRMNPCISEAAVAAAMQEDPIRARREFMAEFTDTDSTWLDLDLIRSAVDHGVSVRPPVTGVEYHMFLDPSSGRGDSFGASVCHAEGPDDSIIVQDALLEVMSPFNPSEAIATVRDLARSYKIRTPLVTDRYAVGWVSEALNKEGLEHRHSVHDRSTLYLNAAALFTSGRARILDSPRLTSQLAGLTRRVNPSGRDRVDHVGANTHDDLANVTCGALLLAAEAAVNRVPIVMPWFCMGPPPQSFEPRW
jgi:hypothetical protein